MKGLIVFVLPLTLLTHLNAQNMGPDYQRVEKTDKEWREQLSPEQYYVARKHGTERAFTGVYNKFYEEGIYRCICCEAPLFVSKTKFDSGTGWPSFYAPINQKNVKETADKSYGMTRVEVSCFWCEAHLGHLFEDGPEPTGLRYCINSVSLSFDSKKD